MARRLCNTMVSKTDGQQRQQDHVVLLYSNMHKLASEQALYRGFLILFPCRTRGLLSSTFIVNSLPKDPTFVSEWFPARHLRKLGNSPLFLLELESCNFYHFGRCLFWQTGRHYPSLVLLRALVRPPGLIYPRHANFRRQIDNCEDQLSFLVFSDLN
jgi:hypothetical protein